MFFSKSSTYPKEIFSVHVGVKHKIRVTHHLMRQRFKEVFSRLAIRNIFLEFERKVHRNDGTPFKISV